MGEIRVIIQQQVQILAELGKLYLIRCVWAGALVIGSATCPSARNQETKGPNTEWDNREQDTHKKT